MLAAAVGLLLLGATKRLFSSPRKPNTLLSGEIDAYISPIIHNEKIGSYRVIENPNDPNIIEVEKL